MDQKDETKNANKERTPKSKWLLNYVLCLGMRMDVFINYLYMVLKRISADSCPSSISHVPGRASADVPTKHVLMINNHVNDE